MKHAHAVQQLPHITGARVVIIQAKWHREYSDVMVAKCCDILRRAGVETPEIHVLPGSLELPFAANQLAQTKPKPDAIIAFGIILKGDTDHYDVVRDQCHSGLMQVMLANDLPIIMEIIPASNIELIKARAGDDEFNKGIEAGLAAVEIIAWRKSVDQSFSSTKR